MVQAANAWLVILATHILMTDSFGQAIGGKPSLATNS